MNLADYTENLASLVAAGEFVIDTRVPMMTWQQYQEFISTENPSNYQAYYEFKGLRIIEQLTIERGDNEYELPRSFKWARYWRQDQHRIFELEIVSVPERGQEPRTVVMTYWVNPKTSQVVKFRSRINDTVIADIQG